MEPEDYDYLCKYTTPNSWVESADRFILLPSRYDNPFKLGDIVRLKSGTAPMKVMRINSNTILCEYVSSRKQLGYRPYQDFVAYEYKSAAKELNKLEKKEEKQMTTKLYKTVEGNRYGEYKANDGDKLLLLMQDTDSYEAFTAAQIKRVMAFTFDVMFNGNSKVYSYLGTEGEVEVGDLLLADDMSFVRVMAVGTESETATKRFKGTKLVGTRLA
jgi:uncharacterized protein YodC (DUF2158 family)